MVRVFAVLSLCVGMTTLKAADDPQDWSKFTKHGEISGVVVKGDANEVILEMPKLQKKTGNNNNRGGRNRRPSTTLGHEHIDIHYAAQGLVRWEKMPQVSDGKGGITAPTGKAFDKLKLPVGAPGYAAERTDLAPGHLVTITLVRPSNISAEKATEKDIVIKYVMIKGMGTPPKADAKDDKKKKN